MKCSSIYFWKYEISDHVVETPGNKITGLNVIKNRHCPRKFQIICDDHLLLQITPQDNYINLQVMQWETSFANTSPKTKITLHLKEALTLYLR